MSSPLKIIAIDGPAGSGKSTVAQIIAQELNWVYINTGAIYRTLALLMLERHVKPFEKENLLILIQEMEREYKQDFRSSRCGWVSESSAQDRWRR